MILPDPVTAVAQNRPNSDDQQTERELEVGLVRLVQLIPSGDVIILPVVSATAQNRANSGDQHTDAQLSEGTVTANVQLIPSGDVIAWAV